MILRSIITAVMLCGVCLAQDSSQSPANDATPPSAQLGAGQKDTSESAGSAQGQTGGANRIAPGSVIPVELTKSIDAKRAKSGDKVEAKVTEDLKDEKGEVIVAKDTLVIGHVTGSQPRNKQQKESQMGIAFDHAVMKSGGVMQLPLSIQAVIAPRKNSDNPTEDNQDPNRAATSTAEGGAPTGNGRAGGIGSSSAPRGTDNGGTTAAESKSDGNQGQVNAPITGETKGVVGISDLKLSSDANSAQGSMLSSDKNNVKLDSGTLLLLRVSR